VLRSVIIHEPPGHRSEPIAHEGEEMFYVLEGAVTVEVAGERSVLEAAIRCTFSPPRSTRPGTIRTSPATILWVGTMDVFGERRPEDRRTTSTAAMRTDRRSKNKKRKASNSQR
jgi:uncharacterized cupin superfamily protein